MGKELETGQDTSKKAAYEALRALSRQQRAAGNIGQAVESLRAMVALETKDPWASRELGMTLYWQNNFAEALEYLVESLVLSPTLRFSHYTIGHIHRSRGDFGLALESYRNERLLNPHGAPSFLFEGLCQHALGDMAQARASLRSALSDDKLWKSAKDGRLRVIADLATRKEETFNAKAITQAIIRGFGVVKLLLVGQGVAPVGQLLLRRAVNVYGVGSDVADIRAADSLAPERFLAGPPTQIPFDKGSFPTVVCLFGLNGLVINDIRTALKEFSRVASRRVLVVCADEERNGEVRDAVWWQARLAEGPFRVSPWTLDRAMGIADRDVSAFLLEFLAGTQVSALEELGVNRATLDDPLLGGGPLSYEWLRRYSATAKLIRDQLTAESLVAFFDPPGRAGGGVSEFTALTPAQVTMVTADEEQGVLAQRLFVPTNNRLSVALEVDEASQDSVVAIDLTEEDLPLAAQRAAAVLRQTRRSSALFGIRFDGSHTEHAYGNFLEGLLATLSPVLSEDMSLRRIGFEVREWNVTSVFSAEVFSEEDWRAALEKIGSKTQKLVQVFILFSNGGAWQWLVDLSWEDFNRAYGGIHTRPLLSERDKDALALVLEERLQDAPKKDDLYKTFYKTVVARLASGYAILSKPNATLAHVTHELARLEGLDEFANGLAVTPELIRWIMSIRRLKAQMHMITGNFAAAEAAYRATIHPEYKTIVPHLLRHVLDGSFYIGTLRYAQDDVAGAEESWQAGVEAAREMIPRLSEQKFDKEFEFSESGNLFFLGQMLMQAADRAQRNVNPADGFPFDIGIANASLPTAVDRFGDLRAAGVNWLQKIA